MVSAASKVPSSKAGRGISRVDIYVNGRPVRSIDAEDGTVPPTPVAIGRGATRARPSTRRRGIALEDLSPFVGRASGDGLTHTPWRQTETNRAW